MKYAAIAPLSALILLGACTTESQTVIDRPVASSSSSAQAVSSRPVRDPTPASSQAQASSATVSNNVIIKMPFATQAPFGNWDAVHEETCEEASLLLVKSYLEGAGMDESGMDAALNDIVAWEEQNGYKVDVTMPELLKIARDHYGLGGRVIESVTVDDIKNELRKGNPVIVPLAGRDVGNPYYSGGGPWYHVLVVNGFDGTYFYTKDVGTKRGNDYKYKQSVLFDAVHDWTGVKEEIRSGPKRVLVLAK